MNIHELYQTNPDEFVCRVTARAKRGAGGGWHGWRDQDLQQVFWLGVIRAMERVRDEVEDDDPLKFLVVRGFGEVRNYLSSNYRRTLIKICLSCGGTYSFFHVGQHDPYDSRKSYCSCGGVLQVHNRYVELDNMVYVDADQDDRIDLELFVQSLPKKLRFVAQRWLLDRYDLLYDNTFKQIALEMGTTQVRIVHCVKRIKQLYQERAAYGPST